MIKSRLLASILFAVALLSGCTGLPTGVEPVRPFDASRYTGEWFEIMRLDHSFERGLSDVTARYTLRADGRVTVENKGYDRARCRWRSVEGEARFLGSADTGSLAVTFFWPFAGGYHVFELDRENYRWAMIAGPTRGYLWILSRSPDLDQATLDRLIERAHRLGFPVETLIRVEHGQPKCPTG